MTKNMKRNLIVTKERDMKLSAAVLVLSLLVVLAGCSLRQEVFVTTKWIPNTASNGLTHWVPGIMLNAEVHPVPDDGIHSWHISWGDGTYDEWNDDSHTWDAGKIGIAHDYDEPGMMKIIVSYDGVVVAAGDIDVPLMETGISYVYGEDGELVEVELLPW